MSSKYPPSSSWSTMNPSPQISQTVLEIRAVLNAIEATTVEERIILNLREIEQLARSTRRELEKK